MLQGMLKLQASQQVKMKTDIDEWRQFLEYNIETTGQIQKI